MLQVKCVQLMGIAFLRILANVIKDSSDHHVRCQSVSINMVLKLAMGMVHAQV